MLCFSAAKGGVGCSVIAAATALLSARRRSTLLVDLSGDLPPLLGVTADGPGLSEWITAEAPPPDALTRLEIKISDSLSVLPFGSGPERAQRDTERYKLLAGLLNRDDRLVVVDAGTNNVAELVAEFSDRSILVTRACYLALAAGQVVATPDDIVLISEQGRALRSADVARALSAPVTIDLRWDPAVARAVDAGLLASRLPRSLVGLTRLLAA